MASNTGVPGVAATRATVTGSTNEKAWSGRFGPQFDFTPAIMGYATYSRGYKGPAYNVFFNMSPTQDNVLAPEKSKSMEVGLKTELLDRRLRLNLAVFDTQYDGYQANVPDLVNGTIVTRLINAGSVSTKGVELDADRPARRRLDGEREHRQHHCPGEELQLPSRRSATAATSTASRCPTRRTGRPACASSTTMQSPTA